MRKELRKLGNAQRFRFSGRFVRFGAKSGWNGITEDTILLSDVSVLKSKKQLTRHLWFNYTESFDDAINNFLGTTFRDKREDVQKMLIERNAIIEFDGRVENYFKGWQGQKAENYGMARQEKDWKISRPSRIEIREGLNQVGSDKK